jgi:hypothetical protein
MPHWRHKEPGLISADGSWAKVAVRAGIAIGVTLVVGVGIYVALWFILFDPALGSKLTKRPCPTLVAMRW